MPTRTVEEGKESYQRLSSSFLQRPGLWNVLYNALLDLEFTSHTKAIAFADDLAIHTFGQTTSEGEAYTNSELAIIENWAKQNNMQFNELKSKTMLMARKKKSNRENIKI